MYEILVPTLAFLSVILIGSAVITGGLARKGRLQARMEYEDQVGPEAAPRPASRVVGVLDRIGKIVSSGQSHTLRERLARAGLHDKNAPAVYLGAKVILLVVGFLVCLAVLIPTSLSFPIKAFLVLAGAAGLFFTPDAAVYLRRQKRRLEIRHHLPDAVDLLEVCVSSGMGLGMAWNLVSDEIRRVSPNLADEMALTNLEIHLGAPRVDAMRHMADRTGADELSSLVAVLVQSERFGTSVADALRTFASSMREGRSAQAEESSEKMAVKLLFPMVVCIFPAMLIVIVGPAVVKFVQTFWA